MLTPSLEDYLEEVFYLCQEQGQARATDLATRIRVSLPSVTKAMLKLHEAGYIEYRAYEEISLTSKGQDVGCYLRYRNQVLGDFLRLLAIECDVQEEVESMEHYISPHVVAAIDQLVSFLERADIAAFYGHHHNAANNSSTPASAVFEPDAIKHMRRFGGKAR